LPNIIAEDNILITELDTITGYRINTDVPKYVIEEPQKCSIAHDEQITDLTGKGGVLIGTLKKGKSVKISYSNGLLSFAAMGSQLGVQYAVQPDTLQEREVLILTEKAFYTVTADTVIDPAKTYYETGDGGVTYTAVAAPNVGDIATYFERGVRLAATTTFSAAGTIGAEIASVAAVGQNKAFVLLENVVQGATVAPGTFTYNPATKELLFDPADVPDGSKIAVTYRRVAQVGLLENDATTYAATDRWVIDALGKDPCGKEYRVQIDATQVDVSGTFTLDIGDTQTVQNVEGRCVKSGCGGGSDSLYKIKVIGLE
jgi:hypothetical protein